MIPPDISPGPWKLTSRTSPGWRIEDSDKNLVCFSKDNPYQAPNAEFIVWVRNNIEQILNENSKLQNQNKRLRKQTRQIRKIYTLLTEIQQWLIDSDQPDTYVQEFKKLVEDDAQIFRESQL